MTTTTLSATTHPTRAGFPLRSLITLSLGVLVTVTAESLPAGLMPEMAAGLGVTPERIGLLISVWALTVIVTSLPLARLFATADRRAVVGGALALFALATVASALAPTYELVLAGRVASAVAHGVFWAVVIVYATSLLDPAQLGRGLAVVTAGGTAATVIGLPVATLVAQAVGWRAAFAGLGLIAVGIAAVVLRWMPRYRPAPVASGTADGGLLHDPSLPSLVAFGAAAVLIAVSQFAAFTYIRPYLEIAAGVGSEWAAGLLFAYGATGLVGVAIAGLLADRFPRAALAAVLLLFVAAFASLTLGSGSLPIVIVALLAWGLAIGAMFPLLQTTLMRVSTERTRTLASAGIVVLFNIGIAVGPWLGGVVGGAEHPIVTTALAAVTMLVAAAIGAVAVLLAGRRLR